MVRTILAHRQLSAVDQVKAPIHACGRGVPQKFMSDSTQRGYYELSARIPKFPRIGDYDLRNNTAGECSAIPR